MTEAKRLVTKARARLVQDHPFFGSLALKLVPVEDPTCKTLWTDGTSMGFNPEFVEKLSLPELVGCVCHEVMHCAQNHTTRRSDRTHGRWNAACDHAINPIIESAGMTLPDGVLSKGYAQFPDMSAEEIYKHLPDDDDGDGGDGSEGGGDPDPGNIGEVRDATGPNGKPLTPDQKEEVEANWKVAVRQAAQQAKSRTGDLPDSIKRMVEDIVNPKLDWREILRNFADESARNDYVWFPPNRRQVHRGMYLPSQRSQELRHLTVAIDTSRSIDREKLRQFAGEVSAIVSDYGADVQIIYCDSAVRHVEEYTAYEMPLNLDPMGGGMTRFSPPFKHIAEHADVPPTCMVYFTDGGSNDYPEEPEYPVLWVLTGDPTEYGFKEPPFGMTVDL